MHILDQVATSGTSAFCPQTVHEFLALLLAQKLSDAVAVQHYVRLIDERSEGLILAAYRRAAGTPAFGRDPSRAFHGALAGVNGNGNGREKRGDRLLSVKVERRSVSVAQFWGRNLDYTETLNLPSAHERSEHSVLAFINATLSRLECDSAAMELLVEARVCQRARFTEIIKGTLRSCGIPLWEVEKRQLLRCFGEPPPRFRKDMRKSVRAIWPVLSEDGGILDAVGLGLYVQTERLLAGAD